MNKATITRLENTFNISINVANKYSGYYAYELQINDYNTDTSPKKLMINNKEPIYKQIERFLKSLSVA